MLSVKKDRRVTVYLYIFLQSKSPRSSAKINTSAVGRFVAHGILY